MRTKSGRGQITLLMIAVIVVLAAAGVVALLMRNGDSTARAGQADSTLVKRGGFDITVPAAGELAAISQIEIRNSLDGKAIITEIVPEGKSVKAGDILLRLNDDDIRTKLKDGQDVVNNAVSALTTAEANLSIKTKTGESDLAKADLQITLADLALKAWQEGEDVSKRQELALAVETAEKEYTRLEERFKESASLLEQKFISLDEYKRDEIALLQAGATLKQAKLNVTVYEKYTYTQDKAKKESDLKQARDERDRVAQRSEAEVRSAQSEVDSKKYALESAKQKVADLEQQLAYCTVAAPTAGLVVYYSSTQQGGMGRDNGQPPQVGTELTRNQPVIVLPDTSRMLAAVKVSEALSGAIKPGQAATIISDAMPDRPLSGEVMSIGVLAEGGGWRDPNRRDYTVRIALTDANGLGLKPSMRCKAEIHVGRVDEALHVPIQAVFRTGPLAYVYVPDGSGFSQKKVGVGRSSELYIECLSGLNEGETVLLREPQPEEIIARLEVPKMPGDGVPGGDGRPPMRGKPNREGAGGAEVVADATPGETPPNAARSDGSDNTPATLGNKGGGDGGGRHKRGKVGTPSGDQNGGAHDGSGAAPLPSSGTGTPAPVPTATSGANGKS